MGGGECLDWYEEVGCDLFHLVCSNAEENNSLLALKDRAAWKWRFWQQAWRPDILESLQGCA